MASAFTPTVRVPLNTMLADLDETLRALLRRDLERHGFDGVDIAFDAPDKEWASTLSAPTVNLFLYDLRESQDHRAMDWEPEAGNGRRELRPPLRLDASYAATAWTRAVEDEHRLLSQVLAVLYAYPTLPDDVLAGRLADQAAQRYPLHSRVAQPRGESGSDFWSAVGGRYKASLDYVVTVSCEPGTWIERGPEVRTQTVRVRGVDGPRGMVEESHTAGGAVRDGEGDPVAEAWVILADAGRWTSTDDAGRFRFDRLRPGSYRVTARAPDGGEGEGELSVPGAPPDITVGTRPRRRKRESS